MTITAHPLGTPGHYRLHGTWLDDVQPDDTHSEQHLKLLGVLVAGMVNPALVSTAPPWLTWNDGETRLHFDYAVADPGYTPAGQQDHPYRLTIPVGLTCESPTHPGQMHEVTRPADIVVPRHVFGIPDDIEPYVVHDEQEKSA